MIYESAISKGDALHIFLGIGQVLFRLICWWPSYHSFAKVGFVPAAIFHNMWLQGTGNV